MNVDLLQQQYIDVPANVPSARIRVNSEQWLRMSQSLRQAGARLLALWGADDRDRDGSLRVYALYLLPDRVLVIEHILEDNNNPTYPTIATVFPSALRMQRAIYDLLGIASTDPDTRGWLHHAGWPEDAFPLRRDFDKNCEFPVTSQPYPFIFVEGDGVHEIAVGPVHAGTIEPGHFRFSVVGEKVLRLEERLGYTHKGIAKRFESMSQQQGHRLAARVSGDSAVAFSWAYCAALEAITQTTCPARAVNLRALALEHERIANHLGDLGALGNDAGFAFGLTQFSSLKEDLLRTNASVFGARYLFDYIVPGGVSADLLANAHRTLIDQYLALEKGVSHLRRIYNEHAGLRDRFHEAGRLEQSIAEELGALGIVGRASGVRWDLRVNYPWPPYDRVLPKLVVQASGDVAARVQVRFDETFESLRLCQALLREISAGPFQVPVPAAEPYQLGIGLIESWRGPVMISLESGSEGLIRRCHAHDSSWQNWPLLEYAILGNIVPDFPLINKSFNLSYSGHDG